MTKVAASAGQKDADHKASRRGDEVRCQMPEASEFRKYADEAVRSALKSTTETERRPLMALARTWTQAAAASDHPALVSVNYSPTDHRTAP